MRFYFVSSLQVRDFHAHWFLLLKVDYVMEWNYFSFNFRFYSGRFSFTLMKSFWSLCHPTKLRSLIASGWVRGLLSISSTRLAVNVCICEPGSLRSLPCQHRKLSFRLSVRSFLSFLEFSISRWSYQLVSTRCKCRWDDIVAVLQFAVILFLNLIAYKVTFLSLLCV